MSSTEFFKSITDKPGYVAFLPNDPTTPELMTEVAVPVLDPSWPKWSVTGWTGVSGWPGTPQFQAGLVYVSIATAIRLAQARLKKPFTKWAGTEHLKAIPRGGNGFNAYYDRNVLRFFYNEDKKAGKIVFTCESSDVVSHELGHGILDALRPDLWNTASMEIFAFHEAFGDIMAMCSVMEHHVTIEHMLKETDGDLSKSNIVSRIAEELGQALWNATNGASGGKDCLRNAVNGHNYVDPNTLGQYGPLKNEPHSFSQVFTGAWYDSFVTAYSLLRIQGLEPKEAVVRARDGLMAILLEATIHADSTSMFFRSVANAMIVASAQVDDSRFTQVVKTCFEKRKIIGGPQGMQMIDTASIDPTVEGNKAHIALEQPILGHTRLIADLPKYAYGVAADGSNSHCPVQAAHRAITYAYAHDLIGHEDEKKMFFVKDGRFKRNYICTAFCRYCQ